MKGYSHLGEVDLDKGVEGYMLLGARVLGTGKVGSGLYAIPGTP